MTTTELIALLKQHEFGASGRPREIWLNAYDENGTCFNISFGENSKIVVTGGGDGCGGASLDLTVEGTYIYDTSVDQ